MERIQQINPFARRESHAPESIVTYKVLTLLTWILSAVLSVYYAFHAPKHGHSIWEQNYTWPTAFRMNSVIGSIYWILLLIHQGGFIAHLWSKDVEKLNAACAIGSHFVLNNLFHSAFILLFVNDHFAWAEVLILVNFFNLSSLYFRHPTHARFLHQAAVSGPLAWTFVAIYWNGAIMVPHPESLVARIFGNIFIWSILAYGLFFIIVYKDYTMGFNLSVLAAAIGVGQFLRQVIALQWIFAFTIMACLFVATVVVAVPVSVARRLGLARDEEAEAERSEPTERAPLLNDN